MAVKQIVHLGEPFLRKKSIDVPIEDITKPYIQQIITDLKDTLFSYKTDKGIMKGVGLAANQVGVNYRIFIMYVEDSLPLSVCINPTITSKSNKAGEGFEGCMSFKHFRARIQRHKEITATAYNENGTLVTYILQDFHARIFQHEYDHLDGTIFIDKANITTLVSEKTYKKKWKKASAEDIENLKTHQY